MKNVDCISTLLGEISIERAGPEDFVILADLINEAVRWLNAIGMEGQWGTEQLPTDPDQFPADWMRGIEAGIHYIAILNEQPAGCLRIRFTEPSYEWEDDANDAGYLSKMAVRREVAGHGIGRALLDWAERWAARHGKRRLRLSCWADNERLCAYYERAGFQARGEFDNGEGWRGRMYEKPL